MTAKEFLERIELDIGNRDSVLGFDNDKIFPLVISYLNAKLKEYDQRQ